MCVCALSEQAVENFRQFTENFIVAQSAKQNERRPGMDQRRAAERYFSSTTIVVDNAENGCEDSHN